MKKRHLLIIVILSISFFLNLSCSFVKEEKEKSKPDAHPDFILNEAFYKVGRSNDFPLSLDAKKIELYEKENIIIAYNLTFKQKDDKGEIQLYGTSDYAHIDTKTENVKLEGNISLNIEKENLNIECNSIEWDNNKKILNSLDKNIKIIYDNKFEIYGEGFSANLGNRTFEFSKIIEGNINEEN